MTVVDDKRIRSFAPLMRDSSTSYTTCIMTIYTSSLTACAPQNLFMCSSLNHIQ
jgi:hypothetical protein